MTEATHGWCSSCKESSAIDRAGNCLWCGGPTEPDRPKRSGWKRPDLAGSKYSERQLRALHLAHLRGASINSLAKQTFERVGYKTHNGAASAISRQWKRMGLKARDRIEQTVLSSTKHGRGRRNRDEGAYRRWLKESRGEYQPPCKGVKTGPPRKGEPCDASAMEGSEFCFSHDPERRREVEEILVDARLRQAKDEMLPMAPFAEWLRRRREELGNWAAVAERLGRDVSLIHNYGRDLSSNRRPKTEIGRTTVRALLEADGTTTIEDLYGPLVVAELEADAAGEECDDQLVEADALLLGSAEQLGVQAGGTADREVSTGLAQGRNDSAYGIIPPPIENGPATRQRPGPRQQEMRS